jgi:cytochrome c oxidase subunit 2
MPVPPRLRRLTAAALPVLLAAVFSACDTARYPNSVFTRFTENNRDVAGLFSILIYLGTFVFLFVEGILLYTIFKYRRKSESDRPEHVHGNTTLEILWTAIPALILAFIAVPTVRTIFKSQAKASSDALQVQVIGHQWWWEFRYPQYTKTEAGGKVDTLVTANELYLPVGRKVNFSMTSMDVIHSFSIPRLAGKRDLMANRTNYLWFTPDSVGEGAWNGFCAEFCGASHANMHFRVFTVTPVNFESWAAHQVTPAAFGAVASVTPAVNTAVAAAPGPGTSTAANQVAVAGDSLKRRENPADRDTSGRRSTISPSPTDTRAGAITAAVPSGAQTMPPMEGMNPSTVAQAGFVMFAHDKLPAYAIPATPIPAGLAFNESLKGDAERGRDFLTKAGGGCLACHSIRGNPMMIGQIGPNLTHVATRSTIAGGIYPNDTKHLSMWIKNARSMKPGVLMPTLGAGEWDPVTKTFIPKTGLNDQQIADIVAYLQALK